MNGFVHAGIRTAFDSYMYIDSTMDLNVQSSEDSDSDSAVLF